MKQVWSPETALKAYLDTVKSNEVDKESSVAELISAMAAGWNAELIVETWSRGGAIATSIGLAIASHHTGGRHVCLVADKESGLEYSTAMKKASLSPEVIVGEPDEAMEGLIDIDFLVVDCRRNGYEDILRVAKLGHRGAVLVCKNANSRVASDFRWRNVVDIKLQIVHSVFLPVGKGLEIAHVGVSTESSDSAVAQGRWVRYFDQESSKEFGSWR